VRVTEVTYTEARLLSTAQYENARVEIGVTVSVESDEVLSSAIAYAEGVVRQALLQRIVEMDSKAKRYVEEAQVDNIRRKYKL
jgi:hypothetical protein